MSIIRIGLSESAKFAEGYEAIFGRKKSKSVESAIDKKKPAPKGRKTGRKKK